MSASPRIGFGACAPPEPLKSAARPTNTRPARTSSIPACAAVKEEKEGSEEEKRGGEETAVSPAR